MFFLPKKNLKPFGTPLEVKNFDPGKFCKKFFWFFSRTDFVPGHITKVQEAKKNFFQAGQMAKTGVGQNSQV